MFRLARGGPAVEGKALSHRAAHATTVCRTHVARKNHNRIRLDGPDYARNFLEPSSTKMDGGTVNGGSHVG